MIKRGEVDERLAWRRDAQPWMLINLVLALRSLGDDAQANRVSRMALELPSDYTSNYHRLWLALDKRYPATATPHRNKRKTWMRRPLMRRINTCIVCWNCCCLCSRPRRPNVRRRSAAPADFSMSPYRRCHRSKTIVLRYARRIVAASAVWHTRSAAWRRGRGPFGATVVLCCRPPRRAGGVNPLWNMQGVYTPARLDGRGSDSLLLLYIVAIEILLIA